jgi:multiple sugar transport system permease protein
VDAAVSVRRRGLSLRAREELEGWVFALPWILGFLLFTLGPMLASLLLSMTKYNIAQPPEWVGLDNFKKALLGEDSLFWPSIERTVRYALVMVPIGISLSFFTAILLNQRLRATVLFRTFFFLPSLTPVVASAILWSWLYQPDFGAINWLLWLIGIPQGPKWLGSPDLALPSLMIVGLWSSVGGGTMIIFLAGLQSVPQELVEAAEIDGANLFQRFWAITVPLMTPTIFFNLVIGVIAALKVFAVALVATNGGPNYATWFFNLHLYRNAFQYSDMGYAAALGWIFFALVVSLTYINVRSSSRWVYYEGEDKQ